jgi:DNA polymerase-3 subunit epsilon/ATP-dependent DNA helicase DinG
MPRVEAAVAALTAEADFKKDVTDLAARVTEAGYSASGHAAGAFSQLKLFHRERAEGESDIRLTPAVRADPSWQEVEMEWDALDLLLEDVLRGLDIIVTSLAPFHDELLDPALPADLFAVRRDLAELRRELAAIIGRPGANDVCWVTSGGREKLSLSRAPLDVSEVLSRRLFADKETVILTSATLRDSEGFGLISQRLGVPDADSAVVPSPFDYASNVLLYLPNDMPEPYHTDHGAAVCRAIVDVAGAARGRTLVLFTSHAELRDAYHKVRGPLGDAGIAVLGQGLDGSRHNLLEGFRDPDTRTVLMGTRSFWEGIDVPGESLSCVVITRLPFEVPTEPVFSARADTFEDSFGEYALPSAVLRFRQGFGRLIRSATDRGVVVVLDKRIQTRAYGEVFLESLPPVRQRVGTLGELGGAVARFLSDSGEHEAGIQPLFHENSEEVHT